MHTCTCSIQTPAHRYFHRHVEWFMMSTVYRKALNECGDWLLCFKTQVNYLNFCITATAATNDDAVLLLSLLLFLRSDDWRKLVDAFSVSTSTPTLNLLCMPERTWEIHAKLAKKNHTHTHTPATKIILIAVRNENHFIKYSDYALEFVCLYPWLRWVCFVFVLNPCQKSSTHITVNHLKISTTAICP